MKTVMMIVLWKDTKKKRRNGKVEITIVSKGPWIVEMYDEVGKKLCKKDADALWGFMISSLNTTQYPEDDVINYESKKLKELRELIPKIKNEEIKEWANLVVESAEDYFNCDYPKDLDNFNGFFEGCQPALDNLIGEENVRRAQDCADLFVEHFGPVCATKSDKTMKLIYVRMIDCLLTMVMDCGI